MQGSCWTDWSFETSLIYGRCRGGLSKRRCGSADGQGAGPSFCPCSASVFRVREWVVQACHHPSSRWVVVGSSRELGYRGCSSCAFGRTRRPGWLMGILFHCCPFYAAERVTVMILFRQLQSLQVPCRFPHVVAFGVPFPFDKVL